MRLWVALLQVLVMVREPVFGMARNWLLVAVVFGWMASFCGGVALFGSDGMPQPAYFCAKEEHVPGLVFYHPHARYLNTGTGRFWTRDRWEGDQTDPLSLHKYLYAHADPVNWVDHSGHYVSSIGLGNRVHKFLGKKFEDHARFTGKWAWVWVNRSVRTILRDRFGKDFDPGLFSTASLRRPDLASATDTRGEVYEIKPAPGLVMDPIDILAEGVDAVVQVQLGEYIEELRRYSPG